jgi:hypothetical protein
VFSLLLAALLLSAPAERRAIAVLPAVTGEGMTASSIVSAVEQAVRLRPGLLLLRYDQLFAEGDDGLLARVRSCGSDVECIARALRSAEVPLGLRVAVNFEVEPPLATTLLVDSAGRVLAESVREVSRDAGASIQALAAEVLEAAGFALGGRILVTTTPADAEAHVEGAAPDPGGERAFTVAPGRYTVRARRAEHRDREAVVVVIAGQDAEVALVLPAVEETSSSAWLWAAIGAAIVGGAAITLIALDPFGRDLKCVCIVTKDGACAPCP